VNCVPNLNVRVFFFSCVRGSCSDFRIPFNIGAHRVSAEKQLTITPQKRAKKSTPAETNQEDHHQDEDNGISHIPEPSNITDQERRAKLEALQKARAEKTTHILEQLPEQQTQENDNHDDDEAIDKEPEIVQQKIQQLQKEKEKICEPIASKKKGL
jgi:hypothetical protein